MLSNVVFQTANSERRTAPHHLFLYALVVSYNKVSKRDAMIRLSSQPIKHSSGGLCRLAPGLLAALVIFRFLCRIRLFSCRFIVVARTLVDILFPRKDLSEQIP